MDETSVGVRSLLRSMDQCGGQMAQVRLVYVGAKSWSPKLNLTLHHKGISLLVYAEFQTKARVGEGQGHCLLPPLQTVLADFPHTALGQGRTRAALDSRPARDVAWGF